jgi:thioredoxin 1
MALRVMYFFQDGCMACHEQEPILGEVEKTYQIRAERINPLKERAYIGEYDLSVTPTILLIRDGTVVRRFEGVVHRERLEDAIREFS